MQSLNVTELTPEQLEQLAHKLPKYTMVNYDSLRKEIQIMYENCPYSMLTWLIILMKVLGTLMADVWVTTFYCKYNHTLNHSKTLSIFWH